MLVTATTNNNLGAIGSAVSDNLITWQDNGPLYVHNSWHVLESVQLIQRNNKFHLFFTEEVVNGTSHMISDSLYSGWDINSRTVIDNGHAPEVNLFDGNYFISRHTVYNDNQGSMEYVIVLDTLKWAGDLPYVYNSWPLINNWNLVWGNAFAFQPTFENNLYARGDTTDANFEGNCWIGTYERYQGPLKYGSPGGTQGDGAKGVIRSKTFTITGNSMNLLVGGGNYPDQCYVAMIDASTGAALFKETGKNTDHMDRRFWDISPYKGRSVYIEISDISSAAMGHINCDDIRESMNILNPNNGGGNGTGKKKPGGISGKVESVQIPDLPRLFQNYPNPFNPSTTISYYTPQKSRVVLEIFDVLGRSIARLVSKEQGPGTHYLTWDGTGARGERQPSGIFFYRLNVDGKVIAVKKMALLR